MFTLKSSTRPCGGCKRCCEGHLTGEAWGHRFYPGKPCGWLGTNGCLIYDHRPHNPCQTFLCEWKRRPNIPQWLKPSESGIILVSRFIEDHSYIRVIESGSTVSDRIMVWARDYSIETQTNIVVPWKNGVCVYSSDMNFRDSISKIYNLVEYVVDNSLGSAYSS